MRSNHLLSIENLSVHFHTVDGTLSVVNDLNLEVRNGEMIGIVGETGCGKSVTAKIVLGILPIPPAEILSGEIMFLGHELIKLPHRERDAIKQYIAYIPQDPMTSLNPTFTIGGLFVDIIIWRQSGRNLKKYFCQRHRKGVVRQAREYAKELLTRVDISSPDSILRRYPMELSGGMRQRVLMAMALIGKPVMLVADEPTTALDVTIQKRILRLFQKKVEEEHLSGIYITHDLGVARIICNRTYVMYAGTVVEIGPTRELLDEPLHPYTAGLVHSIPKLSREAFGGIKGLIPDYLYPPEGCRFHPRCSECRDICSKGLPPLTKVTDDRWVACNHFSKLGNR